MTEVDRFQAHRPALFAVAYRMLGSATDADDVLQDAWLRFSAAQPPDLRSVKAYLTTIVTRLCLDRLKSARATGSGSHVPTYSSRVARADFSRSRQRRVTIVVR